MSEDKDTTSNEFTLTAPSLSKEEERKAKACARSKAWREANPDKVKAMHKAWREKNKEKEAAKRKIYDADPRNKERIAARKKEWHAKKYPEKREHIAAQGRAWAAANKERVRYLGRVGKVRRSYGLTPDELSEMIGACEGRCPCCKVPFSEILGTRPCVDHEHKNGRGRESVRGILCHRCNLLIGHAADDPKILRAAARYLDRATRQTLSDSQQPELGRSG